MNFQRIVIIIATILLILALTFIGYSLYINKHNMVFPPVTPVCPDYWKAKNNECINTLHLGTCKNTAENNTMNFNVPHYQGNTANCNKFKWAKDCNISWDGITNNPKICDSS